jgi:hypothetical protein
MVLVLARRRNSRARAGRAPYDDVMRQASRAGTKRIYDYIDNNPLKTGHISITVSLDIGTFLNPANIAISSINSIFYLKRIITFTY